MNLQDYLAVNEMTDILSDPRRIFNADETSFSMCPKTGRVIAPKGWKNIYQIQNGSEKETITALMTFSAAGEIVTPMVVFPYVRVPADVVNSVPHDWFLGRSDTGWMVSETFYEYIANGFNKWLIENNVPKPVILFVDGHKSHLTLARSKFCDENQIILYALPPNTTHMMQPADVSVFKPLKSDYKKTVRVWQNKPENFNTSLTKTTFCPLLKIVLEQKDLSKTIINGFRKCGLYPLDPEAIDCTKCVQNTLETLTTSDFSLESTNQDSAQKYNVAAKVIVEIKNKWLNRGIDPNIVLDEIKIASRALEKSDNDENTDSQSSNETLHESEVIVFEHDELLLDWPIKEIVDSDEIQFVFVDETNSQSSQEDHVLVNPVTNVPASLSSHQFVSPTFNKHLTYPVLGSCKKRAEKSQVPSAISSTDWRRLIETKEKEKKEKQEALAARKLERIQKKNDNEKLLLERKQKRLAAKMEKEKSKKEAVMKKKKEAANKKKQKLAEKKRIQAIRSKKIRIKIIGKSK